MENHDNTPNNQSGQAPNQPQGEDGGTNTILIVLLITIVLVIGFFLLGGAPAPENGADAPANDDNASVDVELPGDSGGDASGEAGASGDASAQ
jgi:hypothetical protein